MIDLGFQELDYSLEGFIWGKARIPSATLETHPAYERYSYKLEQGWLFGRKIDNSDHQYASFRKHIPVLVAVVIGHQIVGSVVSMVPAKRSQSFGSRQPKPLALKAKWNLWFSLAFIFALFGLSALKILAIVAAHYYLVKRSPASLAPALSWIFCIGTLFANDYFRGYPFSGLSSHLAFLDRWGGVGLRWNITFNFTVLRMISFSMDWHWAQSKPKGNSSFQQHADSCLDCSVPPNLCKRQRMEKPHPAAEYNFDNYLIYLLYAPLYMAGPIVSFNDYWHQMNHKPASVTRKETVWYTLRWFAVVFLMEVMMHYFSFVAIKDTKAWKGFSPFEIFLVGFFNLKMIWLKLLIIWRFFRMWAMCDGVETTENMGRCMSNHYSGIDFWREWHSSFNKWLIRYMYVPLGGSQYRVVNMFPIFTFVAIWHDIEGRLLAWGWLIVLFILPEMAATRLFVNPEVRSAS
ncbi:glycerol transporter [Kappamyces sp. JEL0680]|nr:glycerol transporter [Kappamyces sp. JEL0680]